jgi:hypothetical protein
MVNRTNRSIAPADIVYAVTSTISFDFADEHRRKYAEADAGCGSSGIGLAMAQRFVAEGLASDHG